MFEDGQFCIIKEAQELVRFIGNMNGDYVYELGVIEDSFGYIKLMRLSDLEFVSDEEAKERDPVMYEIFMENEREDRYE